MERDGLIMTMPRQQGLVEVLARFSQKLDANYRVGEIFFVPLTNIATKLLLLSISLTLTLLNMSSLRNGLNDLAQDGDFYHC